MRAVLQTLQCLIANDEESCRCGARVLMSASDTAQFAQVMANFRSPPDAQFEVASDEEIAWQEKALDSLDGRQGLAQRGMFNALGRKPPHWLEDWRARSLR